jgi:uroporphyrinogen-III synthase
VNPLRLLVTRPDPNGARTAALLRGRGHDVLHQALLRIEPVADPALGAGPWAAVLFTSANAVRAVAGHGRFSELAGLPACTVGQRTRAAAAAAGFAQVTSADGDVKALAERIASTLPPMNTPHMREGVAANSSPPPRGGREYPAATLLPFRLNAANLPLLYCTGEDRAGDLAGALRAHGLQVETVCVYRASIVADLAPDVCAAFAGDAIDAILHYSARTAAAFVAAATTAGIRDLSIQARHLCLSSQVAAPLAAAGATTIDVASEPNEQALFALIAPASLSSPAFGGG